MGDMVRGPTYPGGRIRFSADYVRGRSMKTTVEIFPDGKTLVETASRGEAATCWVVVVGAVELFLEGTGKAVHPHLAELLEGLFGRHDSPFS